MILTLTAVVSVFLMVVTLGIQGYTESVSTCIWIFLVLVAWLLANVFIQRKVDPELSVEVARVLYPSGAILSIFLSWLLSLQLKEMIPGDEGIQHLSLLFVGFGVALFLGIRCFDIKWLRLEEEILNIEGRRE